MRLGRCTALALAGRGVHLALHYHVSEEAAGRLAGEIRAGEVDAWTFQADFARPGAAEGLLGEVLETVGPLDILVNNASIFPGDSLQDLSPETFHRSMELNALAPFLLARAFAAQERAGSIVNFLDARLAGRDTGHVSYHLSKRTLHALTRLMALEFAPRVRVNAVAPGLILPPRGEDDSYLEGLAGTNPLQRHGTPEEVADAVLFLLGNAFVTGQVIYVDGGRHMKEDLYG